MTRKTLLMVCYYYPPVYNSGVERSAKFARYLPAHGWEPVVMTTDAYGGASAGTGPERVVRTPELLNLYRWLFNRRFREARKERRDTAVLPATTPGKGPAKALVGLVLKWVMIPDVQIGWVACAFWPAWRLTRAADAIYTTSPTESSHVLGLTLKRLTGKPWVMDLRDPWTFESVSPRLREPGFRRTVETRLEKLCFERADAIVLNTPQTMRRYAALYPGLKGKMRTIPNGFDGEELARAAAAPDRPAPWQDPGDALVLSHAGTFFRYEGGDGTPHAILEALKGLLDEGTITPKGCRAIFAGNLHPDVLARIRELGLEGLIETPGVISHFDAARLMLRSDLLLLYDPQGDGQSYVRGKLYEYIGSGKPILGVVPDGASRELLARSGRGTLVYPDDAVGIRRALAARFRREPEGEPGRASENAPCGEAPPPSPDFDPSSYERSRLAGELAALLDGLLDGGRSAR